MRAMILDRPGLPLRLATLAEPKAERGMLLVEGEACGVCRFCISSRENLCVAACCTGYQLNSGFAQDTVADARYRFPLAQANEALDALRHGEVQGAAVLVLHEHEALARQ